MELQANAFDLWVFERSGPEAKYLLLHSSQEKADKWFNGGRFWQTLGDFVGDGEAVRDALVRALGEYALAPQALWIVDHVYTVYNRRREDIEVISVFAAEVDGPRDVPLTWEHAEFGWFAAEDCHARINFRGTREGLDWLRKGVTENPAPAAEFRLE